MARVTVEDCVEIVQNRFELVALASQRAKDIASGATLTIERDNDKNAVVALREIAERTVSADKLRDEVVQNLQRYGKKDVLSEHDLGLENRLTDAGSHEIMEEMESLNVNDIEEDSFSFADENLEVED